MEGNVVFVVMLSQILIQKIMKILYESGSVIDVHVKLTANHFGTFHVWVCYFFRNTENILMQRNLVRDCFLPLLLEGGSSQYNAQLNNEANMYSLMNMI
ncbi:hypothetical protein NQ317_017471 [Molorchus minor]|uniref:Uncharacterized protein n=1 Tax=Molorchus minor TaxID=1323400 RepID=A0ABQ9IQ33_9CUCU|nr:hypothetical protein NQ317_017471 [Molorchus minor]